MKHTNRYRSVFERKLHEKFQASDKTSLTTINQSTEETFQHLFITQTKLVARF